MTPPRKNAAEIRKYIESADFSDTTREHLLDQLFHYENATELKTAKAFTTVSSIILLVLVVASFFFQLSGTTDFSRKDVIIKGVSLMITDVQIDNDLTFIDGLKRISCIWAMCRQNFHRWFFCIYRWL